MIPAKSYMLIFCPMQANFARFFHATSKKLPEAYKIKTKTLLLSYLTGFYMNLGKGVTKQGLFNNIVSRSLQQKLSMAHKIYDMREVAAHDSLKLTDIYNKEVLIPR